MAVLSKFTGWFDNQAMARKVFLGQAAVGLIFMTMIILNAAQMLISRQAADRASDAFEASIMLRTAHAEGMDVLALTRGIVMTESDFLIKVYDDTSKRFHTALDTYRSMVAEDPDRLALVDRLLQAVTTLETEIYERQIALVRQGTPQALQEAFAIERDGTAWPPLEQVLITIGELMDKQRSNQVALTDTMHAEQTLQLTLLIVAAIVAVIAALTVSRFSGALISKPVEALTAAMRAIVGGNKNHAIPHTARRDEIGEMARAVTVFRDALVSIEAMAEHEKINQEREMLRLEEEQKTQKQRSEEQERQAEARRAHAEALSGLVADFEAKLLNSMENVENASAQMGGAAGSVATLSVESRSNVQAVSRTSEEMKTEAGNMAAAVEEFTASMNEVTRNVRIAESLSTEAATASTEGADTVDSLKRTSETIGSVVSVISDIAEQTNLLALNATIEAARAGDAGKGFAVVASEVKALASQTAKATDEIRDQVDAIQSVSETVQGAIGITNDKMTSLHEVLAQVTSAVEEQATSIDQLSQTAHVTLTGSQAVTDRLVTVQDSADAASNASDEMRSSVIRLEKTAADLREEVDSFLSNFSQQQAAE